jgi:hypothetical protein
MVRARTAAARGAFAFASTGRACAFVAAILGLLAVSSDAHAQLHWDASAQVGAMKRFLAARPSGGDDAAFGPTAQLMGHIALMPLVHAGAYFGHDISPLGDTARNVTFGGVRAKGVLPFVRSPWRAWIFAGFGYAGVYQQSFPGSFSTEDPLGGTETSPGRVEGAGGGFFDVPFGLSASYKLYGPWEACAELGTRIGFGHTGSVYESPGPQLTLPNAAGQNVLPAGLDRVAVGLTLGIRVHLGHGRP